MFEQFYLNITSVNPNMDQSIHYVTRHYLEVLTQLDNDLLQVATCAHFRRAERNYTCTKTLTLLSLDYSERQLVHQI